AGSGLAAQHAELIRPLLIAQVDRAAHRLHAYVPTAIAASSVEPLTRPVAAGLLRLDVETVVDTAAEGRYLVVIASIGRGVQLDVTTDRLGIDIRILGQLALEGHPPGGSPHPHGPTRLELDVEIAADGGGLEITRPVLQADTAADARRVDRGGLAVAAQENPTAHGLRFGIPLRDIRLDRATHGF